MKALRALSDADVILHDRLVSAGVLDLARRDAVIPVELIEPRVICTLGNFATKLIRGDPAGITRVHGQPEVRAFGEHTARIYPLFHPAAALYTPRTLETLREDFARLPELLALGAPEQPLQVPELDEPLDAAQATPAQGEQQPAEVDQLGLF